MATPLNPNNISARDKGRETLYKLDPEKLYIVEGQPSGVYETNKSSNIRFALKNVVIRDYNTTKRLAELPTIAYADHINVIRKAEGMQHVNLKDEDKVLHFIGKLEFYTSSKDATSAQRVSLKVFRDIDLKSKVLKLMKRLRNFDAQWDTLSTEVRSERIGTITRDYKKLVEYAETYYYVPWYNKKELGEFLSTIKAQLDGLVALHTLFGGK